MKELLTKIFVTMFVFFIGCSASEQAEQKKIRELNAQGELIYRRHQERLIEIPPLKKRERERYPWEEETKS
jgi:hypothetical protein